MPIVRIDITGPKSDEYRRAVLHGVRSAIIEGLGAPDERVSVRLHEIDARDCALPSCRTDRFTVVDVMLYAGRTDDQKLACTKLLRELLSEDPSIPGWDVAVAYHDLTPVDLDVLPGRAADQDEGVWRS